MSNPIDQASDSKETLESQGTEIPDSRDADISDSQKLMSESTASKRYDYSTAWFQKMRWKGGGPPYIKIGKSVRYPLPGTDEWFNSFGIQH